MSSNVQLVFNTNRAPIVTKVTPTPTIVTNTSVFTNTYSTPTPPPAVPNQTLYDQLVTNNDGVGFIKGAVKGAAIGTSILPGIGTVIGGTIGAISGSVKAILKAANTLFPKTTAKAVNWTKEAADDVGDWTKEAVKDTGNWIGDTAKKVWKKIKFW